MKLADAHTVAVLASQRDQMQLFRDRGKISGSIDLGGHRAETLDPIMIELIRPVIAAELNRRIAVIDHDLLGLGVDLEDTAALAAG